MPQFQDMFARVQIAATTPPEAWFKTDSKTASLGLIERSFPSDYEQTDSITDHYVEHVRIKCHEKNYPSPLDAWQSIRDKPEIQEMNIRDKREAVYQISRGCNLFNVTLGTYLINCFTQNKSNVAMLDCCAGWGDRLIAAHASVTVTYYHGFDPNPELQAVYANIATACNKTRLPFNKVVWNIECMPFEDASNRFLTSGNTQDNLSRKFDLVLTSPPFFNKELYLGKNTSTNRYRTLYDWNKGFYIPMLKQAARALRVDGYLLLYIADNMFSLSKKILSESLVYLGKVGFRQTTDGSSKKSFIRNTYIFQRTKN